MTDTTWKSNTPSWKAKVYEKFSTALFCGKPSTLSNTALEREGGIGPGKTAHEQVEEFQRQKKFQAGDYSTQSLIQKGTKEENDLIMQARLIKERKKKEKAALKKSKHNKSGKIRLDTKKSKSKVKVKKIEVEETVDLPRKERKMSLKSNSQGKLSKDNSSRIRPISVDNNSDKNDEDFDDYVRQQQNRRTMDSDGSNTTSEESDAEYQKFMQSVNV